MISFQFELNPSELQGEISALSMGHITVVGANGSISSKNKYPDQSMMIFPSLSILVDQVAAFLITPTARKLDSWGIDSSFCLQFVKIRKKNLILIKINSKNTVVDQVTAEELSNSLLDSIQKFLDEMEIDLLHLSVESHSTEEAIFTDLRDSIADFRMKQGNLATVEGGVSKL